MRNRKEIKGSNELKEDLILEVLLDIREILDRTVASAHTQQLILRSIQEFEEYKRFMVPFSAESEQVFKTPKEEFYDRNDNK
jgi:hypothetical protein